MLYRKINAKLYFTVHLRTQAYLNFVGSFHSCTGNEQLDNIQAEELLKSLFDNTYRSEEYKYNIINTSLRGKSVSYHLDLELKGDFWLTDNLAYAKGEVWNYMHSLKQFSLVSEISLNIENIDFYDNLLDLPLKDDRYVILNNDMSLYLEDSHKLKSDVYYACRTWYNPLETEEYVQYLEENPEDSYDNYLKYEGMSNLPGYATLSEKAVKEWVTENKSNYENFNFYIYRVFYGGDFISFNKDDVVKYEVMKLIEPVNEFNF